SVPRVRGPIMGGVGLLTIRKRHAGGGFEGGRMRAHLLCWPPRGYKRAGCGASILHACAARIESTVDFPHPDGPEIETHTPAWISRCTPASAWISRTAVPRD